MFGYTWRKLTSTTAACLAVSRRGIFFEALPVFWSSNDSILTKLADTLAWYVQFKLEYF